MARHYIKTTVTFWYESSDDEFADESEAEEFGWNYEDMHYDGVYSIEVDELDNEYDEDKDE
jgi:hypothetical protein